MTLTIFQACDNTITATLKDRVSGDPLDLTDCEFVGQIFTRERVKVADFTIDNSVPLTGVITLTLSADDSVELTLERYLFDVLMKDTDDKVLQIMDGEVVMDFTLSRFSVTP